MNRMLERLSLLVAGEIARARWFLMSAALGVAIILTVAVIDNPNYARQLRAAIGLATLTPTPTFTEASGEGRLKLAKGLGADAVRFAPKYGYAYAYERGYNRKTVLVLTAEPADLDWQNAYAADLIRDWSRARQGPFVMVELNDKNEPSQLVYSVGNGQFESDTVTTFNGGLRSIELVFEINDGTRLKGRLQVGDGNCGGRHCDPQMDYSFDVSLLE
jgi:hypothetical protein